MRIHFERSGGLAAPAMRRTCTIDTQTLPENEARELIGLVESAGILNAPAPSSASAAGRDMFHYRLTVEDGSREQTISVSETDMPEPLRRLVTWLNKRA